MLKNSFYNLEYSEQITPLEIREFSNFEAVELKSLVSPM